MSVSNYACGGGAGACSGDEALANEHEYHQAQIDRRCRVCGQICKNTYTHKTHNETADDTSNTKACDREGELNAAFGIVVEQDMPHIHPTGFCNKCYSKMKKNIKKGTNSAQEVFNWQPHSDGACSQCQYFQKQGSGGRPKTTRKGRPKSREVQLVAEDPLVRLCKSACPSWNAPQALSLASFLPPATGLHLSDLQCPFCSLIVDRPVQTACGKVVCCTCIIEYTYKQRKNKEVETFPCCSGTHVTPPIPAAAVVTQVIGSLLLCCDTCKQAVALKEMRDHTDSGCTTGIVSSQQTVEQILARPLGAPATTMEKKLATAVIKRMIHSPTSSSSSSASAASSSSNVVSLPTGGQVRPHISVHAIH